MSDAAQFYKVRTAAQDKATQEVHIKMDYYNLATDLADCLHGSFVPSTQAFYESSGFVILSCTQQAISQTEYEENSD